MMTGNAFSIDRLLDLWTQPLPEGAAGRQAIRRLYTDPVQVNGNPLTADDLADRVNALQAAIESPARDVLDIVQSGDKVAVAFRLSGRHVGAFATSAGVLEPTGQNLTLRVIDILTLTEGRINSIVMVADELAALHALRAVQLLQ
jgi:ketosteroid isomerase-like protein